MLSGVSILTTEALNMLLNFQSLNFSPQFQTAALRQLAAGGFYSSRIGHEQILDIAISRNIPWEGETINDSTSSFFDFNYIYVTIHDGDARAGGEHPPDRWIQDG